MKLPKLTVIIEHTPRFFVATCPELDIVSQGKTFKEAERNIQEAVELFLECASEKEINRRLERKVQIKRLELAHA
ncbi:MAG: type II toxin-antitoxin system HicB family antitoxin [bacterium]